MPAATLTNRAPVRSFRSKRLLALAGDERLVEQIRRGNEVAFEVLFERHGAGILGFCRHMLGSREEAEDAVQHTFAAAFKDLQRPGERAIALKAWLYTIARNRCVSVLRARREQATELHELATDGLSEQVERRAELRALLADVGQLPEEQRAALLLAEAAGLAHADVAEVLGCEVAQVKGLVFRARSALIDRRMARETPCGEIREQLATLRGGALRRNELRHHLRSCPGCSAYRDEVRRQRQLLAVALPVAPSVGLKGGVMGAAGLSASAVGGASAGGAAFGSAVVAKVALVGVLAGGSVVAGEVAIERAMQSDAAQVAPAADGTRHDALSPAAAHPPVELRGAYGEAISSERNHEQRGEERRTARSQGHAYAGSKARTGGEGHSTPTDARGLGRERQLERLPREPREHPAAKDREPRDPAIRNEPRSMAPVKPVTEASPTTPTTTTTEPTVDETAPLAETAPVQKVAPGRAG